MRLLPVRDADKDVDTGGMKTPCESPPPLPSLIFESSESFGARGNRIHVRLGGYLPSSEDGNPLTNSSFQPKCGNCASSSIDSLLTINNNNFEGDCNSNPGFYYNHVPRPHETLPWSPRRRASKRSHSLHENSNGAVSRGVKFHHLRQTRSSSRGSTLRSSSNLASILSSLQSLNLGSSAELGEVIHALRKERSLFLQEIETEDEERNWFYQRLQELNHQLALLLPPAGDNGNYEVWRVEGEIQRVEEALQKHLGPPEVMVKRREERLHSVNSIEKTIQRLQQEALEEENCPSTGTSFSTQTAASQRNTDLCSGEIGKTIFSHCSGNTTMMDAVNANQIRKEDSTADDISDLRELESYSSDTVNLSDKSIISHRVQAHSFSPPINQEGPGYDISESQEMFQDAKGMPPAIEAILKGTWPFQKSLWHSSPASMEVTKHSIPDGVSGIMSTSSITNRRAQSQQQLLSNKMEMVYGLLSMFSSGDKDDMSRTLLAMSSSSDSCVTMRQSGCLPLLVQLLHGSDGGDHPPTREIRLRASQTLHNIVHSHPDDKRGRREARVLRLLEQIRDYSDYLYERLERTSAGRGPLLEDDMERHPCPAMAALMKLSFDEDHRHAMGCFGGLHAIAELIRRDHDAHGSSTGDQYCIALRRYAGMALTNLTFGDGTNKTLLCSFKPFMKTLVSQLSSPSEELRQVTASILRNLSWRADTASKNCLREIGAVTALMEAALSVHKESTLKVILSAVWNLSAHCSYNKAEICSVDGALAFLCSTLSYKSQSKTLAIVENGGGILRNISSHIAVQEELRQVLREHNTLSVLLGHLRSPSLTVVSNACGTLWNLSARCAADQRTLWELGAVPMLRSLINSKHKMISMGSSAALKNLLQAKPEGMSLFDPRLGNGLPTLQARKQKALEEELDPSLAETCDNIESSPHNSPTNTPASSPFVCAAGDSDLYSNARQYSNEHDFGVMFSSADAIASRDVILSDSRDSIVSFHSDNSHNRYVGASSNSHNLQDFCINANGHGNSDVVRMKPEELNGYIVHSEAVSEDWQEIKQQGQSSAFIQSHRGTLDNTLRPSVHDPHYNLYHKYVNNSRQRNLSEELEEDIAQLSDDQEESFGDFISEENNFLPLAKINNYMVETSIQTEKNDMDMHPENNDYNVTRSVDYTVRYSNGKNRSSDQSCTQRPYFPSTSYANDDSTKTYCTEGTPYQTPYAISTATSMSDLREANDKEAQKRNRADSVQESNNDDEDDTLFPLKGTPTAALSRRSEQNSGIATPDRLITYYTEGTPLCLSRFSSASSLSSGEVSCGRNSAQFESKHIDRSLRIANTNMPSNNEQKGVTYEDTPLMFSRATSVSSLSSFDVNSVHDDRSSVVSEFSRFNSGAISPSDLPDSPSQTMPHSPKMSSVPSSRVSIQNMSNVGVFGDTAKTYREEGTPYGTSRAHSPLSVLTVDDSASSVCGAIKENRLQGDGKDSSDATGSETSLCNGTQGPQRSRCSVRSGIPKPRTKGKPEETRSRSSEPPPARTLSVAPVPRGGSRALSEDRTQTYSDTDSDGLLFACIKTGMSKKEPKPVSGCLPQKSPRPSSGNKLPPPLPPPPPPPPPRADLCLGGARPLASAIPIKTVNIQVTTTALVLNDDKKDVNADTPSASPLACPGVDYVKTYCTENTPVNISQSGSLSDLSQLSYPSNTGTCSLSKNFSELQIDSGDNCSDNDNLLEQCIKSAMPKARSTRSLKESKPLKHLNHNNFFKSSPYIGRPVARVSPAIKGRSLYKEEIIPKTENSTVSVQQKSNSNSETPCLYITEGTPAEFSRCESLSSLSCDEDEHTVRHGTLYSTNQEEVPKTFCIEGMPAEFSSKLSFSSESECEQEKLKKSSNFHHEFSSNFSRNSSLNSLDVEEESQEQVLLQQCINQGMPKSKSDLTDSRTPIRKRTRIPALSKSSGRMVPGVPMQRLNLIQVRQTVEQTKDDEDESVNVVIETKCDATSTVTKLQEKDEISSTSEITSGQSISTVVPADKESPHSKSSPCEEEKIHFKVFEKTSWSSGSSAEMRVSSDASQCQSFSDNLGITQEAFRVAQAVAHESDEASQSITSDVGIEQINPPSAFDSVLSLSTNSADGTYRKCSPLPVRALECRHTKKLPEVVRRALCDQEATYTIDCGNTNSMVGSCHSNLDNIGPPPFVEDDMESSMISVSSITSEIVDQKSNGSPPSINNNTQSVCSAIIAPAEKLAQIFSQEANQMTSTLTLVNVGGVEDDMSTYQEVTEIDCDDTLTAGRNTHHSDSEDDICCAVPDLPPDSPASRRSASHVDESSKITPKMKRILDTDRFKTFTKSSSTFSPKSRRHQDADRFRTRTICMGWKAEENIPIIEGENSVENTKNNKNSDKIIPAEISYDNIPQAQQGDIIELNDAEVDLTTAQLEAISQDANIVICTLNETREGMKLAEPFCEEGLMDVETLSLISNDDLDEEERSLIWLENQNEFKEACKGPRIVKPSHNVDHKEQKGIRGKRKVLYSNRKQQIASAPRDSQQKSNPKNVFVSRRSAQPPNSPKPTRASTLRQSSRGWGSGEDSGSTCGGVRAVGSSPGSSSGSSPRLGPPNHSVSRSPLIKPPKSNFKNSSGQPVSRQSTFTKDSSKPLSLAKILPSKLKKDDATKAAGNGKSFSLTRDAQPPSAKDVAQWKQEKGSSKGIRKDVTSRIAQLWKRVEKAQVSSKDKSETKLWIGPKKEQPHPLIRSSTYEKITAGDTKASSGKPKSRLGLKFSRFRGRDTKSSPPSEATTPAAETPPPKPQCLVSPTTRTMHNHRHSSNDSCEQKRVSRLGSFFVVDEEVSEKVKGIPQSAVVAPYNYVPPSPKAASQKSCSRIPQAARVILSNYGDDNGNPNFVPLT